MLATGRDIHLSAVRTTGSLLPADMLLRLHEGRGVSGCQPNDYGIVGVRSISDEAERHWSYLRSVWQELRKQLAPAPQDDPPSDPTGTAVAQWVAPLLNELGFGRLSALRVPGIVVDDDPLRPIPITYCWQQTPIHVVAWDSKLGERPQRGAISPHGLLQQALNRSPEHLWGIATNGRQLRILRDSNALATTAYVEFDLEAMFDGELFSEFVLLFRLCHASRFELREAEVASSCWLERWRIDATQLAVQALDALRDNVERAIAVLGTGFLRQPENSALRVSLDAYALHEALLRLVYRTVFLFTIEDRNLLHDPNADAETRKRYATYFSTARLRRIARRSIGDSHHDLYEALRIVLDALGDEKGCPELGLYGLGGLFTSSAQDDPLRGMVLSNEALLAAVRHLGRVWDPGARRWRTVDYRYLGARELGSVYEALLATAPEFDTADLSFRLVPRKGNERKRTGAYYTPSALVECLLDSTLDPLLDDAVKKGEQAAAEHGQADASEFIASALLSLTVCDPSCGSGHFLVAVAQRIAKRVAAVRESSPEPTEDGVKNAMHDAVARCVYGVDINPMAVDLAKVFLWMEGMAPGRPLDLLDPHIKCGNSLIGATPKLLNDGVPDSAFAPVIGDDRKISASFSRINANEFRGEEGLFDIEPNAVKVANTAYSMGLQEISRIAVGELRDVRRQEKVYQNWLNSEAYRRDLHIADAWCAAFMWEKTANSPRPITHGIFRGLQDPDGAAASPATHEEIIRLRKHYRFFHWHLEFPDVFRVPEDNDDKYIDPNTGWDGGFDCVVGNPPWERIKLQEQEFFAQRDEEIAGARNAAARRKLIAELKENPYRAELYQEFEDAKRRAESESHFLRNSGRYRLTGRGDINTYAVFAEADRELVGERGRMGVIIPTGIATDATTQHFFKDLMNGESIAALYDFENRKGLFPAVDSRMKFCVVSLAGRSVREPQASFAFFLCDPAELASPDKAFTMTPEEISLLNPNTGTCPVFRSRRDAEITLGIYKRVPVLIKEGTSDGNPWGFAYTEVLHMSHAATDLLDSPNGATKTYPVYEAKMMHHFDHRWFTYDTESAVSRSDAQCESMPRYWVPVEIIDDRLHGRWDREWMIGWRDICRATDERTVIAAVLPRSALAHTLPLAVVGGHASAASLVCGLSSFVLDYAARQKVAGTHLTMIYLRQLPVLPPEWMRIHQSFLVPRSLELVYTSYAITSFAKDLGDFGPPFRWDEERRAIIRAELDALFFHLYGVNRDDADYIMETFPIVKRKDEERYGTYRTKNLILETYDRMAAAGISLDTPPVDGENFTSTLTPPPGHGPRHPAASR